MILKAGEIRRTASTLIELLVVMAIVGVLMGLILSAVQRVRSAADRAKCVNNLRQIGIALQSYHGTYSVLPPGHAKSDATEPYPSLGWQARILPFVELNNEWNDVVVAYRADLVWLHNPPHVNLSRVVSVYTC